ncbi:OsmC family protein [bacterium]|nr:OsmC family protein [bacterium]
MAERVVVYQDHKFRTEFKASDEKDDPKSELAQVGHIHQLTPHGMVLAGLASCTAIVLNSYANNHEIPLKGVRVDCRYDQETKDDCKDCEEGEHEQKVIREALSFEGDLDDDQLKRLHQVAKACSVGRMLENGIKIISE